MFQCNQCDKRFGGADALLELAEHAEWHKAQAAKEFEKRLQSARREVGGEVYRRRKAHDAYSAGE